MGMRNSGSHASCESGGGNNCWRLCCYDQVRLDDGCDDREMSEVEKLMDIMTREYNAFVVQSAAVADLVKKVVGREMHEKQMDILKKKFIEIRNKEIEQRRKNLTCKVVRNGFNLVMAGMTDVLANVIDDPFKVCKDKSLCV